MNSEKLTTSNLQNVVFPLEGRLDAEYQKIQNTYIDAYQGILRGLLDEDHDVFWLVLKFLPKLKGMDVSDHVLERDLYEWKKRVDRNVYRHGESTLNMLAGFHDDGFAPHYHVVIQVPKRNRFYGDKLKDICQKKWSGVSKRTCNTNLANEESYQQIHDDKTLMNLAGYNFMKAENGLFRNLRTNRGFVPL